MSFFKFVISIVAGDRTLFSRIIILLFSSLFSYFETILILEFLESDVCWFLKHLIVPRSELYCSGIKSLIYKKYIVKSEAVMANLKIQYNWDY